MCNCAYYRDVYHIDSPTQLSRNIRNNSNMEIYVRDNHVQKTTINQWTPYATPSPILRLLVNDVSRMEREMNPTERIIYSIQIPRWTPAKINDLLKNRFVAQRLKKADTAMIAAYSRHIPKATVKRHVGLTVMISGAGRPPDPDAFTKSLNDALVRNGLLVDDSSKWVVNHPVEIVRSHVTESIITLVDIL